MLVDVVELRHEGIKRSRESLRSVVPVRGMLVVETRPWRQLWCPHEPYVETTLALLRDTSGRLMPELHDAHVRHLVDLQLVVTGIETVAVGHSHMEWPQAWWCRLVSAPTSEGD